MTHLFIHSFLNYFNKQFLRTFTLNGLNTDLGIASTNWNMQNSAPYKGNITIIFVEIFWKTVNCNDIIENIWSEPYFKIRFLCKVIIFPPPLRYMLWVSLAIDAIEL